MNSGAMPGESLCGSRCSQGGIPPKMVRILLTLTAITIVSFVLGTVIVLVTTGFPPVLGPAVTGSSSVPLDGAKAAEIVLFVKTGDLIVSNGTGEDTLLNVTVAAGPALQEPVLTTETSGDTRIVRLTGVEIRNKTVLPLSENTWNIRISDRIPVALDLHIDTGETRLDAGGLNLSSLSVNSGTGSTVIDLGGYHGPDFSGKISNHVGELTIRVPADRSIRITVQHNIGDIKAEGFDTLNGSYVTSGWRSSQSGTELVVEQGVGSVHLVEVS